MMHCNKTRLAIRILSVYTILHTNINYLCIRLLAWTNFLYYLCKSVTQFPNSPFYPYSTEYVCNNWVDVLCYVLVGMYVCVLYICTYCHCNTIVIRLRAKCLGDEIFVLIDIFLHKFTRLWEITYRQWLKNWFRLWYLFILLNRFLGFQKGCSYLQHYFGIGYCCT